MIKEKLKNTFAILVISGLIISPFALILEMPKLAAIGNSMFIAGVFTPIYFTRKCPLKFSLFFFLWLAAVINFAIDNIIDYRFLFLSLPLFVACIAISKWSKVDFTPKSSKGEQNSDNIEAS